MTSSFLIHISDQMKDSQQENKREKSKNKDSYVAWIMNETTKLVNFLVNVMGRLANKM